MIAIRRARASDAAAIGALHVAVWRSAYAGILPDAYLAGLSATRLAAGYQRDMFDRRGGYAVFVAVASGHTEPIYLYFSQSFLQLGCRHAKIVRNQP